LVTSDLEFNLNTHTIRSKFSKESRKRI